MAISEQIPKQTLTTEGACRWLLEYFLSRMSELCLAGDLPKAHACLQLAAIVVELLDEQRHIKSNGILAK